ncbi:MAG TPA: hypothetical protein VG712_04865 [Gemmatimonadales bacterium]|nr:hypothetical protein [Gemmatimonadales bacterium]
MTLKGRHWVMLWLVVALGALGSVAARQSSGYATAQQLRLARDERASLEARRGELERRIRQASSRQVLVPRAEANLGLHEPAAGEITVLVIPADQPGGIPVEAAAPRDTVKKAAPKPRATVRTPSRRAPARRAPTRRAPTRRH